MPFSLPFRGTFLRTSFPSSPFACWFCSPFFLLVVWLFLPGEALPSTSSPLWWARLLSSRISYDFGRFKQRYTWMAMIATRKICPLRPFESSLGFFSIFQLVLFLDGSFWYGVLCGQVQSLSGILLFVYQFGYLFCFTSLFLSSCVSISQSSEMVYLWSTPICHLDAVHQLYSSWSRSQNFVRLHKCRYTGTPWISFFYFSSHTQKQDL